MARSPMPPEQIVTMLKQAPARIAEDTAGLAPARLRTVPNFGEWSAVDVLAHLRSCADVWGKCIQTILTEDGPTIRAMDPRTWAEQTDYRTLAFAPSLQAYTRQRARLVKTLQGLSPKDWARSATVTGAGKPLVRTAHFYAQWMAGHERAHLKQIARIAKALRA